MAERPDPTPGTATILVAHGSRNPRAQTAHEALVESVRGVTEPGLGVLLPAYLEMAEPGIAAAIDSAVDAGASEVRVLPCFLHPGNHVEVDIPEILAGARRRHPDIGITQLPHLGSDSGLVELLAAMVGTP